MPLEMNEEKVTRMIANLLRRANHETTPKAEAKSARRKAEQLMEDYGIQVVLDVAETVPDYEELRLKVRAADAAWVRSLAGSLAPEHACNAYFQPTPAGYGYLILTGTGPRVRDFRQAFDRYSAQFGALGGKRYESPSFRLGCAAAVYEMFSNQRARAREAREARETGPPTALTRARRYVFTQPPTPPYQERVASDGDHGDHFDVGSDDLITPPEVPIGSPDATPAPAGAWQEPPVNAVLYRIGYQAMRRALGVFDTAASWMEKLKRRRG